MSISTKMMGHRLQCGPTHMSQYWANVFGDMILGEQVLSDYCILKLHEELPSGHRSIVKKII